MQPEAAALRHQPHEGVVGLPDLFGELFDVTRGQFRIDPRLSCILQLDLDSLKVDHAVPLPGSMNLSGTAKGKLTRITLFCNCS